MFFIFNFGYVIVMGGRMSTQTISQSRSTKLKVALMRGFENCQGFIKGLMMCVSESEMDRERKNGGRGDGAAK